MTISCIGCGNMGSALMKGARSSSSGFRFLFTDADRSRAEESAKAFGGTAADSNARAAAEGDFVFLAVKPQIFPDVLTEIAPAVKERTLDGKGAVLVSMAPGWSVEKIQGILGLKAPTVRIMPNTPALVGRGVIALSPSAEVPEEKVAELERLLSGAGLVDRVQERYLEAVAGVSGSGPAYVYMFIEALADGGVKVGLPRDKALKYAAQTVLGAAAMVLETGKHPGELKDMVTSPGGTTIAAVAALENAGFRAAAIGAVEASYERAVELG
ncbi:MAG: pyrroline-5-carboxylate reductase [Treponema sp.]|nr:pyrroline-5-carboxylate reductase [Treponema sp.]